MKENNKPSIKILMIRATINQRFQISKFFRLVIYKYGMNRKVFLFFILKVELFLEQFKLKKHFKSLFNPFLVILTGAGKEIFSPYM